MNEVSVELLLPQEDTEGEFTAYDAAGRPVALPAKIVCRPAFYRPDATTNLLFCKVRLAGNELQRTILQVPGRTGRLRLLDRTVRASPAFSEGKAAVVAAAVVDGTELLDL